jgi:hypothetical protein
LTKNHPKRRSEDEFAFGGVLLQIFWDFGQTLVDLGVSGGGLGEQFLRFLVSKFWSDFSSHFWEGRRLPRRVTRRLLERTFGEPKGPAGQDLTRPRPTRGRADCLRFASPAEAIGGLDAWMLGGLGGRGLFGDWGLGNWDWRLGIGI